MASSRSVRKDAPFLMSDFIIRVKNHNVYTTEYSNWKLNIKKKEKCKNGKI